MLSTPHTAPVISSEDNSTFKALKKTLAAQGIRRTGSTVVAGSKLVADALRLLPGRCLRLIIPEGFRPAPELLQPFARPGTVVRLKKTLFREIDIFQTGDALLELAVPEFSDWDHASSAPGCTLMLPFQDPVNVGGVVRSALAFGVGRIVLLREAAHPFHPKSIRASGGAVFSARFVRGPALADLPAPLPAPLVCLDMHGRPIQKFSFPASFLLLPGTEGQGLPERLRTRALAIPMSGAIESLNAATAVAIALFCWHTARSLHHHGQSAPEPGRAATE